MSATIVFPSFHKRIGQRNAHGVLKGFNSPCATNQFPSQSVIPTIKRLIKDPD